VIRKTKRISAPRSWRILRKAAKFDKFSKFKFKLDLVRFFSKSDALLKFFEELAYENVTYEMLADADAYAEFGEHLEILKQLETNYKNLLNQQGYTDKAFMAKEFEINRGFLTNYEQVEIFLEGYLSLYEITLLSQVSQYVRLIIHYSTSRFNLKMQERFKSIGISLPNNSDVVFDMSQKRLLETTTIKHDNKPTIYAVEERIEQVAQAFVLIEEMVRDGIKPENIVLVLPDENLKNFFMLFDNHNNLNFSMGYDYSKKRAYRLLEALYNYWHNPKPIDKQRIERFGMDIEQIDLIASGVQVEVDNFFTNLELLGLLDISTTALAQKHAYFKQVLREHKLTPKEWLFLWLNELSKHTIDDIRGGKITVLGVLETRGVEFDGVVIVDFNDGIVPASSSKDQFLNSSVRLSAGLPTKQDRESLQKQYYKRLLDSAISSAIVYSTAQNRLPSKFLYELGIDNALNIKAPREIFYDMPTQIIEPIDPEVNGFDAKAMTWSASRLKVFLECKRKFYYRYIKKIKQKPQEEVNEGAFLHELLEKLFENNNHYDSRGEMQKAIDKELGRMLPLDDAKSDYRRAVTSKRLQPFVASQIAHFKSGFRVVAREEEFSRTIAGVRFRGTIDRIDQDTMHTIILDYKSGSTKEANRVKNLENLTEFQMSVYSFLTDDKYANKELAFLKILDGGKIEQITALEEKNELLLAHIEELKCTTSFIASRCEDLSKCKYCEFRLMCGRGEYV